MVRGRKQQRGDLVGVDIGGGKRFDAVALTPPLFAFLEGTHETGEPVGDVRLRAVLFKICVTDIAVKSGRCLSLERLIWPRCLPWTEQPSSSKIEFQADCRHMTLRRVPRLQSFSRRLMA